MGKAICRSKVVSLETMGSGHDHGASHALLAQNVGDPEGTRGVKV